jgi:murein DD-endopeptidase MepM/ murein hydrolase activator NlpD
MALAPLLAPVGLPLLNAPFLATTVAMLFLLGSKRLNLGQVGLRAIPLEKVSTPEAFLDLLSFSKKSDQLRLTLPFYGLWFVAQGTHGLFTHWGHGSYAWDFIVVDQQGKSCRGIGRRVENYYAFGLPVVAPAAGTVVDMLDSLPDNIPPEVNKKKPWGNYIVIDHGNGLYSELSHLRRHGCTVQKGQWVAREQIIGYVGNSGLSMEPHLHYQLQQGHELGANTLPAKFWGYYHHNGARQFFVQNGVPQQGELISNHVSPPGSQEKRR